MADDENFLEKQAVEFLEVADFNQVKPTNIEAHFGAMQLSTAISMKRIADVLQQWIDLVTAEPENERSLDEVYLDGFKAGQRSMAEDPASPNFKSDHIQGEPDEDDQFIPDDSDDDYDPDIDPPEEDPDVDGIVPSKNQMS